MAKKGELLGKIFGRLTVMAENGKNKHGHVMWLCRCECGKETVISTNTLNRGHTRSCGCLMIEGSRVRFKTHGHRSNGEKPSSEYQAWVNMKQRCGDLEDKNYGGRGISVCDRWANSYENFLSDMGIKPHPDLSLDRFPDTNGNYEPGNCRWGTDEEQAKNKRNNHWVEYKGKRMVLTDWADYLGVCRTLLGRHLNHGKSFDETISLFLQTGQIKESVRGEFSPSITYKDPMIGKTGYSANWSKVIICNETDVEFGSISEAARQMSISIGAISHALTGRRPRAKGYSFRYKDSVGGIRTTKTPGK
jgi:hypothetical protein